MAGQKNDFNLGYNNASFQGNYGFSIIFGPRRYAGIGVAISDGKGNFRAHQKLNVGTGTLIPQRIVGTYNVYPDGTGDATVEMTLPDGQVLPGAFDYVVLTAEKRGNVLLATELQGIDRNPAFDLQTGKPLEPIQLGVSWFKRLP